MAEVEVGTAIERGFSVRAVTQGDRTGILAGRRAENLAYPCPGGNEPLPVDRAGEARGSGAFVFRQEVPRRKKPIRGEVKRPLPDVDLKQTCPLPCLSLGRACTYHAPKRRANARLELFVADVTRGRASMARAGRQRQAGTVQFSIGFVSRGEQISVKRQHCFLHALQTALSPEHKHFVAGFSPQHCPREPPKTNGPAASAARHFGAQIL